MDKPYQDSQRRKMKVKIDTLEYSLKVKREGALWTCSVLVNGYWMYSFCTEESREASVKGCTNRFRTKDYTIK